MTIDGANRLDAGEFAAESKLQTKYKIVQSLRFQKCLTAGCYANMKLKQH
jgi:invasion protein IalB